MMSVASAPILMKSKERVQKHDIEDVWKEEREYE
jgi:hypothetical protein